MNEEKTKIPFYKKWWVWLIAGFIFLIIVVPKNSSSNSGSNGANESGKKEQTFELTVTANTLFEAYQSNQISAEEKYKGKVALITGTVDNIGKDIVGSAYIALKTDNPILTVQCYFEDQNALSKFSKGENVKIIGKIDDFTLTVSVKECEIYTEG